MDSARRHHIEAAPRRAQAGVEASDAIEVRAATPEDAEAIAQLLYENYHLSYVHADFYRPRYLMAALASGELLSTIAVHDGRVIGHHALMPLPGVPSAETGAAVVHSAYRGLGVFGRLFEHTLDAASERGLASVFGDAVTIHPFSQRAERSHGYRETALQLGMVPAQTTMRGFGGEGPRRRTATLRSYRPFDEQPRQVGAAGRLPRAARERLRQRRAHDRGSHRASSVRGRGGDGRRRRAALSRLPAAPALGRDSRLGPEAGCAPPALAACRRRLRRRRPGGCGRCRRGDGRAERARLLRRRPCSCTGRTATTTSGCSCSIPRRSSSTTSSATRRSHRR